MFRSDNNGAIVPGKLTAARTILGLLAILACLTFNGHEASAQEVGSYAHVDAGALNLRTAPGTGASVIRALPFGTTVSVLDRRGSWVKVFVQGAGGEAAEGWVATRYLGQGTRPAARHNRPAYRGHDTRRRHSRHTHRRVAPLRVSQLDFDCRPALFGNSGIRKCVASVRVQLPRQEFDPGRGDRVYIACRGMISYRTDRGRRTKRLRAFERASISRDDRLGQSVRVNFPVRSERDKIISARLASFSCGRD